MIYLFVLILTLIPVLYKVDFRVCKRWNWYYIFLCVTLTLFSGLRNQVGGDTFSYIWNWEHIVKPLEQMNETDFLFTRYQPLWILLNSVAMSVSKEFWVLQMLQATIVNVLTFIAIDRITKYRFIVVVVYYISMYLYFNMEIMRESIAVCIMYFAFESLIVRKNYLKYYLLLSIGFLFHDSCILFTIFPFFLKYLNRVLSLKDIIFVIIFSIIVLNPILIGNIISNISVIASRSETFHKGYGSWQIGSILGYIRSIIQLALIYIVVIRKGKCFSSFLLVMVNTDFFISIMAVTFPILSRTGNYFSLYTYIAIITIFCLKNNVNQVAKFALISILLFAQIKYYVRDVTSWVGHNKSTRYYFYELFIPYWSIVEEPDKNKLQRRILIHQQEELKATNL